MTVHDTAESSVGEPDLVLDATADNEVADQGLDRERRTGLGRRRRGRGDRPGREPLRPSRSLVRRPHLFRLREQGPLEHGQRGGLPWHRGPGLRGRDPHGGRRRIQGRQEGHRPEEGLPGLPPGALRPRRRHLGRHSQHPGRDGVRGTGHQADPLVPARGGEHPAGQGGGRRGDHEAQPPPPRVRGGRDGSGEGRPVRRLLGPDRRNQRGPAQVEGAGQHLWTRDAGRARVQPSRRSSKRTQRTQEEEGDQRRCHQRSVCSPL